MHSTQEYPNTNIKELVDNNTVRLGNFNTPLASMDRSSKQKINKETMALNDTLEQMDLTDMFRYSILTQQNTHALHV